MQTGAFAFLIFCLIVSPEFLIFSKPNGVKSTWVIPPINIPENQRGSFPKAVAQIKSEKAKESIIHYGITGPGADLPPAGLFKIDRDSGWLLVTEPLDREKQSEYLLTLHAVSISGTVAEEPMEIAVIVLDQNDNRPEFVSKTFLGKVREGSAPGVTFMTVTATDKDDPNSDNGIFKYSILSQTPSSPSPHMFTINQDTGSISVISPGLDREKSSKYDLIVQVADMNGDGLSTTATAIIDVVSKDEKIDFPMSSFPNGMKNTWVIPPINVPENQRGVFPKNLAQIKSSKSKESIIHYSITGSGADLPPAGLFEMDKTSGWLLLTEPLDREKQSEYVLTVHAVSINGDIAEDPVPMTITVIDQNDNKPEFISKTFVGKVREGSTPGVTFMTVTAIDKDDPNTDHAKIKYSILSQIPPNLPVFAISPDTGSISVMSPGLDREKAAKYKLIVEAADMNGEGLRTLTTAIIDVVSKDDKMISNAENTDITTDIVPIAEIFDITKAAPATNLKFELFRKEETPSHIKVWNVLSKE
ncbi:cadherin-4-like [Erpetoichthys calabaricus]|uniref:cadherin-4-like n=1 Tax=Erpetoichthys calabaricus TaxID=27687 RepID=UPI0022347E7B|nr:cadherin-4-like [Erpetoichthys calabaricus]